MFPAAGCAVPHGTVRLPDEHLGEGGVRAVTGLRRHGPSQRGTDQGMADPIPVAGHGQELLIDRGPHARPVQRRAVQDLGRREDRGQTVTVVDGSDVEDGACGSVERRVHQELEHGERGEERVDVDRAPAHGEAREQRLPLVDRKHVDAAERGPDQLVETRIRKVGLRRTPPCAEHGLPG